MNAAICCAVRRLAVFSGAAEEDDLGRDIGSITAAPKDLAIFTDAVPIAPAPPPRY
jgi:hypothetical protein